MSIIGNQLLPLNLTPQFRANYYNHHNIITPLNPIKKQRNSLKLSAKIDDSSGPTNSEQELNLSVLRFTFGIPGFDESYLPRWIGYGFGSLIVVNHFFGSNFDVTSAQLVSEALGLSLAAFSIALPFVGRFLKGATPEELTNLPQRAQQIFVMSPVVSDSLKEDLAWTTYILLRNTKSFSVLIYLQDAICIRGYWNLPENLSKDETLNWFLDKINKSGLPDVDDTLNFSQTTVCSLAIQICNDDLRDKVLCWLTFPDGFVKAHFSVPDEKYGNNLTDRLLGSVLGEAIPEETSSMLIQPLATANPSSNEKQNVAGFVLVASSISYAYDEKDVLWIKAISNKFKGEVIDTVSEIS